MRSAVFILWLILQGPAPRGREGEGSPPKRQTAQQQRQAKPATNTTPPATPATENYSGNATSSGNGKSAADWWIIGLTGGLLLVAAFQVGLFWRQLDIMNEGLTDTEKAANAAEQSAAIARETLIAANRPWVFGEFRVASDLTLDGEGAHITFDYTLENVGNTPAINVDIYPRFFPFQMGKSSGAPPNVIIEIPQTNPAEELLTLRESIVRSNKMLANAPESFRLSGDTIFPGKNVRSAVRVSMGKEQIDVALAQRHHKEIGPVLIVLIDYQSSLEPESHQTGLIFNLVRLDASKPRERFEIDPANATVAMSSLRLERYPFRSGFAN